MSSHQPNGLYLFYSGEKWGPENSLTGLCPWELPDLLSSATLLNSTHLMTFYATNTNGPKVHVAVPSQNKYCSDAAFDHH